MSDVSTIDWLVSFDEDGAASAGSTFNIVGGCERKNSDCRDCYAVKHIYRMQSNPRTEYYGAGLVEKQKNGLLNWTGKVIPLPSRLAQLDTWKKGRKVFVCSLADLFHKDVPKDFLTQAFDKMLSVPQHTYIILTKRPDIMADFLLDYVFDKKLHKLPANLWLGTSCGHQEAADDMIKHLIKLRGIASVLWLSCEPLTGPLDLTNCKGSDGVNGPLHLNALDYVDWVVAGAESGSKRARKMKEEWVRFIAEDCGQWKVPFFYKQAVSEGGRKIHTPELDGRRRVEFPA